MFNKVPFSLKAAFVAFFLIYAAVPCGCPPSEFVRLESALNGSGGQLLESGVWRTGPGHIIARFVHRVRDPDPQLAAGIEPFFDMSNSWKGPMPDRPSDPERFWAPFYGESSGS